MSADVLNSTEHNESIRNTLRILVVDDEPDALQNMSEVLTQFGHLVDSAPGGESALALAREHQYDLALLDFRMPKMDGLELARKLCALQPCLTVMLVTAYLPGDQEADVLSEGKVRKVLSKPLDIAELIGSLESYRAAPTVLVVDDDRDLCANLREAIENCGYRVCIAHDFQEAESRLESHNYQIAIFDYRLPGGSGIELSEEFLKRWPGLEVLLMTGYRQEVDQQFSGTPGPTAKIYYKPFHLPDLLAALPNSAPPRG